MPRKRRDGLYRRGNVFAFRYKDEAGKWCEKQTGKHDREAAKTFRDAFLKELRDGTMPTHMADYSGTVPHMVLAFRKPRIASGTLDAEGYRLRPLIRILGNTRLKLLTNIHLDQLRHPASV